MTVLAATDRIHDSDFADNVRSGLTASRKKLSCRYFYDDEGSKLFEKICHLPEYYLTGAEYSILEQQAATIASMFHDKITLVELGSGSAVKTHVIIKALIERHRSLRFIPIDISRST